ncbi:MAG: hypothetical protein WD691_02575 [Acidimicrobiales bacterium]
MTTAIRHRLVLAMLTVGLVAAGCSGSDDDDAPTGDSNAEALVGLFRIDAGTCDGPEVKGSYFRMVQSGGTLADGPFVANGDSPCEDNSLTMLAPGTDGGLLTDEYQPQPEPAFDDAGNAVSARITEPTAWFAVAFGMSTNEQDPQTGRNAPAPRISVIDGVLTGNLSAVGASWNGQAFNQGAPKPGGAAPGATTDPIGTYDAETGVFTLDWTSQIEGGPFSNFTGVWHLEGTFEPR